MKKAIISSALRLVPKRLQLRALCSALNYICKVQSLQSLEGQVIKLNVSDLKKSWFVICLDEQFQSVKSKKADLEVKTTFAITLKLQDKALLMESITNGDVVLIGEPQLVNEAKRLLSNLEPQRLINLSNHFFKFLKIKSPHSPRLDINQVSLSDLKTPADVDFIIGEAIKLESHDLEKSLSLMLLAKNVRPNGQLVVKKVAEYQQKMGQE